ncbi:MAG TPA: protein kinase [Pyrinomonadaceae bacterium]|nr:protein kinase [Pyrinomonadaceae bacterium]
MAVSPNTKLGRYEIKSQIGAGGMGEVYLAEDTRLERTVALKVLPAELATDQQRMHRFVQEAKTASALNHPNILTIYEIEEIDSINLIATEFIDGETLRARIQRAAISANEALDIATQIASALAAAHDAGIVHRDLKPENIMLRRRDGIAKLLDFGIAKLSEPEPQPGSSNIDTEAKTRAQLHTAPGTVMGTMGYMSPEQARGLEVDARTDIWSLGVVLYEMIAGRAPFVEATATDVLVAVLQKEAPPLAQFSPDTPEALEWIITKALRKDKEERYQTAKELASDLRKLKQQVEFQTELERSVLSDHPVPPSPHPPFAVSPHLTVAAPPAATTAEVVARKVRIWLLLVPLIVAVAAVAFVLLFRKSEQPVSLNTLPKMSQLTFAEGVEQYPAWSADGKQLAYSGEVAGIRKIFRKNLETGEETQLTKGSNDDIQPVWSPDGETLLFVRAIQANQKLEPADVFGTFEGGDIWSVNVRTGNESKLIDKAVNPAFSPDGKSIAFDAAWVGTHRIWIADSQGHNAQQLTSDTTEEMRHVRPRWSPDGTRIVFQNVEGTKFNVRAVAVAQRKLYWVTNDLFNNLNPVWSQSGKFIYFSSDRGGGYNVWRVQYSSDGVVASSPQQITTGAGQDVELAMSPDGRRLALSILRQNADVWRLPVSSETGKPTGEPVELITTTREDSRASWSPDGTKIAFNSDRSGDMNIWLYTFGDGSTKQLTRGPGGDFQGTWSPDGKSIVFFSSRSGNADIWLLEVETSAVKQLTSGSAIEINPFYSPDGKLIAYQSDQTGRPEVWVMNADGSNARQLTRVGVRGHFLRWNKAGDAVIFRCSACEKPGSMQVSLDGSEPVALPDVTGGAHMSLSPDYSLIMDVLGHKTLWVSPVGNPELETPNSELLLGTRNSKLETAGAVPEKVFEFKDKDVRIDYPVWSPDGKWVLFDRFRPQGGDIWMIENFE